MYLKTINRNTLQIQFENISHHIEKDKKSLRVLMFVFFLFSLLFSDLASAQNCDCDHVIKPTTGRQRINADNFDYKPGDTFCFLAAHYESIRLEGFKGTALKPLIFKNCDGQTTIGSTSYPGLEFINSKYIHLTGEGEFEYGIKIIKSHPKAAGLTLTYLSSDFEVDHIEISDTGFAGIVAKTDPSCKKPETWKENFVMRNLNIHDNYIHDTGGEGMYIGATYGYEYSTLKCLETQRFAHLLENIEIHHNRIINTGWDALQVSLAHLNLSIHDNWIDGYGAEKRKYQLEGIAIGSGCRGEIYNNTILQKTQFHSVDQKGISLISAIPGFYVYNNVIVNPGGYGVWLHTRMSDDYLDKNERYYFYHNTIVRPVKSGFFYNTCIPKSGGICRPYLRGEFRNNLIVETGDNFDNSGHWRTSEDAYINFQKKEQKEGAIKRGNVYLKHLYQADFEDFDNHKFSLKSSSQAISSAGILPNERQIPSDIYGFSVDRLQSNAGAAQFDQSNRVPIVHVSKPPVLGVNSWSVLDASKSYDMDGKVESFKWLYAGGASDLDYSNQNTAKVNVYPKKSGTHLFFLKIIDNDGGWNLSKLILETNTPPQPVINSNGICVTGLPLAIDGYNSLDEDGEIVEFRWSILNMDTHESFQLENPVNLKQSFVAEKSGQYEIALTIKDDVGTYSVAKKNITCNLIPSLTNLTRNQSIISDVRKNLISEKLTIKIHTSIKSSLRINFFDSEFHDLLEIPIDQAVLGDISIDVNYTKWNALREIIILVSTSESYDMVIEQLPKRK